MRRRDGDAVVPGEIIGQIEGRAATLLAAERTALNFLQRLSGIATETRRFVAAAAGRIVILDTRKTTPGLRLLEKYAVATGGGTNHRLGLFDALLIKDNHVRLAGGIASAVGRARAARPGLRIEVEVQTIAEVDEALEARADVLLLDNMTVEEIRTAVRHVRGRAKVEISGGVTLARVPELAETGADYLSAGALTHSAPAADISFEIEPV
jgi:nicotinate-nucleotide pyrophosphorylase (carboxylating)